MQKKDQEYFSVRVDDATLIPDEDAMREFVDQLNAALEKDSALKARFKEDPGAVFGERGVPLDVQRELLEASGGLRDFEFRCSFTCVYTTPHHCGVTIVL
ncbi:hypothetical protein [Streptomyces roseoverticillatus]|uniref:Uncharacterized protein n=1 Tax=Streptomyces roseoverticillatus TaxID=66429 RepID=A0ABV3IY15_9ACTN